MESLRTSEVPKEETTSPLESFWQDESNIESVIASTVLGRKDDRAREFERLYQAIPDQGSGLKAEIKEDFKLRMTAEFERNPDHYAELAVARAESITDLFHIFDQFKKNEKGNIVIGGVENEELKKNIKTASEDIRAQVQRGELVNPELEQINFALSLYHLPTKYNIAEQVARIIRQDLAHEAQAGEITPFPILEEERPNKPKIFDRLKKFFLRRG